MLRLFTGLGLAAALGGGIGCNGANGGTGTPASNADESWADVHPPASIDITSCASVVDDASTSAMDACISCCDTSGYDVSSFINQGHCTCAHQTPEDQTTCATKTATDTQCFACCQAAGYQIQGWIGGDTPSCSCDARTDAAVCQSTLTRSDPADQCALCCLNHGFLSDMYVGIGKPECSCAAP
jgi:hypothetical protein